jgi:hypothetical protein
MISRLSEKSWLKILFADLLIMEEKHCSLAENIRLIIQVNRANDFQGGAGGFVLIIQAIYTVWFVLIFFYLSHQMFEHMNGVRLFTKLKTQLRVI